jgi:M6 family metalloprotease-like protein
MPALDGSLPAPVSQAFAAGLFPVTTHPELQTTSVSHSWLVPIIMVSFSDSALTHDSSELQYAMFDTTHSTPTGSVVDYYDWVSTGRIHVRGEVVARITLPHPANYYANSTYGLNAITTPQNDLGLVQDAVAAADPTVDWNRYDRDGDGFVDMLWIVHAGVGAEGSRSLASLWSITGSAMEHWSNGGAIQTTDLIPGVLPSSKRYVFVNRFSILPERSSFKPGALSEIGVYCHEFGHALGLPDLYDTSSPGGGANVGPGLWSLMSTGAWGGDGHSPEYPTGMGAWSMLYLGLSPLVQPAQDTVVTVAPISSGGAVYEFFSQGLYNPEHFLVEQRYRQGFDRNLPANGLLVTQVDDAVIGIGLSSNRINAGPFPGMRVLEGDGDFDMVRGWNRGDSSDVLPGAMQTTYLSDDTTPSLSTFGGSPTNLVMDAIQPQGSSTRVRLRVRAPGWYAGENYTEPTFTPTSGYSRGRHNVVTPYGDEVEVFSDARSGVSQVMLRTRAFAGTWSPASAISASPAGAFDPTLALLPHGGLAVAWSDLRDGQSQIYYRCRTGGTWGGEQRLSLDTGGSPAIAADAGGLVHLCWFDSGSPRGRIQYLNFPGAQPGGTPQLVTDSLSRPSAPSIAATIGGGAWMAWPDLATGNYVIDYARFRPDSGLTPRLRLTYPVSYAQPSVDLASDPAGNVHFVWQQLATGACELHYQRFESGNAVNVLDTVLVSNSGTVQNPSLWADPTGALHLVFERSTNGGQLVQYKRWRAGRGWDYPSTDVSSTSEGSAGRISVVAVSPGDVSVSYASSSSGRTEERTRRRRLDAVPLAVDPGAPVPARRVALQVAPNPLRAGRELLVRMPNVAGRVELFDAVGRRVASTLSTGGFARFTPAQTRDLEPGLYFAALKGGESGRLVVIR